MGEKVTKTFTSVCFLRHNLWDFFTVFLIPYLASGMEILQKFGTLN